MINCSKKPTLTFIICAYYFFQKIPGTSDPEESEPESDESSCLIDGPDSDGYTFLSDGHSRGWCKVVMDFSIEFC